MQSIRWCQKNRPTGFSLRQNKSRLVTRGFCRFTCPQPLAPGPSRKAPAYIAGGVRSNRSSGASYVTTLHDPFAT